MGAEVERFVCFVFLFLALVCRVSVVVFDSTFLEFLRLLDSW